MVLCAVSLGIAGCAGGNAIDQAVPQAAFADFEQSLPAPAEPGSGELATTDTSDLGTKVEPVPPQTAERAGVDAPVTPSEQAASADELPIDPLFVGSGAAVESDTYPNMNIEPERATEQLTNEQSDALMERMRGLSDGQGQGTATSAQYKRRLAELRRLAATHSEKTIEIIEQ